MAQEDQPDRALLRECVRRNARLSFSRSGGKGGQNVNRVATKVLARVRIGALDVLSDEQKDHVREKLATRIGDGDEIAVFADDERVQSRNREIALDRLAELIARSAHRPRKRVRTRTPRRAHEIRLQGKRVRAGRKRDRRPPPADE